MFLQCIFSRILYTHAFNLYIISFPRRLCIGVSITDKNTLGEHSYLKYQFLSLTDKISPLCTNKLSKTDIMKEKNEIMHTFQFRFSDNLSYYSKEKEIIVNLSILLNGAFSFSLSGGNTNSGKRYF